MNETLEQYERYVGVTLVRNLVWCAGSVAESKRYSQGVATVYQ
jgi:hypothetical protein